MKFLSNDMTSTEKPRSGWWTLAVILALPWVYLLSVPPIIYTNCYGEGPPWLIRYAYPAKWVSDHTPLGPPLHAYSMFWSRMMGSYVPWAP